MTAFTRRQPKMMGKNGYAHAGFVRASGLGFVLEKRKMDAARPRASPVGNGRL
jgi:hypothetical protein